MPNKNMKNRSAEASKGLSPAMRVFNTVELFEQTYMDLDQIDLLRAERVSRDFKMIIDCSKPLQRRLFYLPADFSKPLQRRLLNLPRQLQSDDNALASYLVQQQSTLHFHPELHESPPFRMEMEVDGFHYTMAWKFDVNWAMEGCFVGGHMPNPPLELRLSRWDLEQHRKDKEADGTIESWKRMFLSQPPAKVNVTVVHWGERRYWGENVCDEDHSEGVYWGYDWLRDESAYEVDVCTLGELFEQVHWESTHIGLFGIVEESA